MPTPQQSHPPQDQESPPEQKLKAGFLTVSRYMCGVTDEAIYAYGKQNRLSASVIRELRLLRYDLLRDVDFLTTPDGRHEEGRMNTSVSHLARLYGYSRKEMQRRIDHLCNVTLAEEKDGADGQVRIPLITAETKAFLKGQVTRRASHGPDGQVRTPQTVKSGTQIKLPLYAEMVSRDTGSRANYNAADGMFLKNTHPKELKSKAFNTSEGETPNIGTEKMGTEVEEANGINQSELEFSGTSNSGRESRATPKSGGLRNSNLSVSSISEAVAQLDRGLASGARDHRSESCMSHKTAEISAVISSTSTPCDAIDIPDRASGYGPEGPRPLGYEPNELSGPAVAVSVENGAAADDEADISSKNSGGSDPEGSRTPVYEPFTKEQLKEISPDESRLSDSAMLGEIDRLVGFPLPWNDQKQIRAYYDALTGETIVGIVERHLEGIRGARKRCGYVLSLLKKYAAGELIEEDRDQKVTKAGLTGMMQRAPRKGQPIRAVKKRCRENGRHNQLAYWNALEWGGVEQVFQKDEKKIKAIADGGDDEGSTAVLHELNRMARKGFKFETVDEALSKVKEMMSDSETYDVPQSAMA